MFWLKRAEKRFKVFSRIIRREDPDGNSNQSTPLECEFPEAKKTTLATGKSHFVTSSSTFLVKQTKQNGYVQKRFLPSSSTCFYLL